MAPQEKSAYIRRLLIRDGEAEPNNTYDYYSEQVRDKIVENHTHAVATQNGTELQTIELKFREYYYVRWLDIESLDESVELIKIARCGRCRIIVYQITGNRDMPQFPIYDRLNNRHMNNLYRERE